MAVISFDEAVKYLPDGPHIHTFRNAPGVLIGADWDREDLLKEMRRCEIMTTGAAARGMNHGLAIRDGLGPLFIETKELPDDPSISEPPAVGDQPAQ